ncbi:MAG TPA: SPFH domain-containing protein [Chloroflexota bacterium]|nr:SPFH domain-containing protein [Chloroflexota bacterium]
MMKLIKKMVQIPAKWFGGRFAPDNHVVPVLRMERYHRLAGPGYFHINPMHETTLPAISLAVRLGEFKFEEVMSRDGIPFSIAVTVMFNFNPAHAIPAAQPQVVRAAPEMLAGVVRNHTEHGLRRQVARIEAETLYSGDTLANVERDLVRLLRTRLAMIGITPLDNGVFIKETLAPTRFRESLLLAKQYQDTLRVLNGQQGELIEQAIRAGLVNGLEKNHGQVTLFSGLDGNVQPTAAEVVRETAVQPPRPSNGTYGSNGVTGPNGVTAPNGVTGPKNQPEISG